MRGLDPRIHLEKQSQFSKIDCRVKPAQDGSGFAKLGITYCGVAEHLPIATPIDTFSLGRHPRGAGHCKYFRQLQPRNLPFRTAADAAEMRQYGPISMQMERIEYTPGRT